MGLDKQIKHRFPIKIPHHGEARGVRAFGAGLALPGLWGLVPGEAAAGAGAGAGAAGIRWPRRAARRGRAPC